MPCARANMQMSFCFPLYTYVYETALSHFVSNQIPSLAAERAHAAEAALLAEEEAAAAATARKQAAKKGARVAAAAAAAARQEASSALPPLPPSPPPEPEPEAAVSVARLGQESLSSAVPTFDTALGSALGARPEARQAAPPPSKSPKARPPAAVAGGAGATTEGSHGPPGSKKAVEPDEPPASAASAVGAATAVPSRAAQGVGTARTRAVTTETPPAAAVPPRPSRPPALPQFHASPSEAATEPPAVVPGMPPPTRRPLPLPQPLPLIALPPTRPAPPAVAAHVGGGDVAPAASGQATRLQPPSLPQPRPPSLSQEAGHLRAATAAATAAADLDAAALAAAAAELGAAADAHEEAQRALQEVADHFMLAEIAAPAVEEARVELERCATAHQAAMARHEDSSRSAAKLVRAQMMLRAEAQKAERRLKADDALDAARARLAQAEAAVEASYAAFLSAASGGWRNMNPERASSLLAVVSADGSAAKAAEAAMLEAQAKLIN